MALFPAYGDGSVTIPKADDIVNLTDDLNSPTSNRTTLDPQCINSSDEAELLKSDQSPELSGDDKKRKHKSEKHKKKKKSKSEHKERDKYKKVAEKILQYEDFYYDKKIDYGNLRVSTLYNPARPHYDRLKIIIGPYKRLYWKKHKKGGDRYYNMKLERAAKCDANTLINSDVKKKKRVHKGTEEYMEIGNGEMVWSEQKVEQELVDKTAYFNKYLNDNPYDIDMWVQFVKFQEDRFTFDCKSNTRKQCFEKQLSILDAALKHNFNSMELLCKKVKLSEQYMENNQYLTMLKQLISTPELSLTLLNRAWFWYLDAMQCSMALCSVPSVKEMYAGAVKVLSKAHKQNYPSTHVDIIYHLGLFLRQCGLWEQLWMLIKVNIEMNLAAANISEDSNFESVVSAINMKELLEEENKIICSGLPTHEVWSRIESLRSKLQWLPSTEDSDDPQRIVFSTDFADFIKPVSQRNNMFALNVNILRLLKIPMLPGGHELSVILKSDNTVIEWENDNIETCLAFVYTIISGVNKIDNLKLKILTGVIKDFAEEPNYLNPINDYFKFVNNIMMQCSRWFEGDETTAILLWWIRFLRVIVTLTSVDCAQTEVKPVVDNFRKLIKDILKCHRDNIFIYKEFSIFEAYFSNFQKGLSIIETCLQALPYEKSLPRIYLARSLVEMLLQANSRTDESVRKSISILMSVATDKQISKNTLKYSNTEIDDALNECADFTNSLLLQVSNFDKNLSLTDHMLPDIHSEWLCCHGWLIYLTQSFQTLRQFYKKIIAATFVEKHDRNSPDSKKKLQLREIFLQWYISVIKSDIRIHVEIPSEKIQETVLEQAMKEFSLNSTIVWYYIDYYNSSSVGRLRIMKMLKEDDLSQTFAVGFIVQNFIQLYKKYDASYKDLWQPGHSNRLLNLLQTMSSHTALRKCALIWRMLIEFVACHTQESAALAKKFLYQALDECPWNKGLYRTGCIRIPSEFSELVDIMVEKQIRLHAMPEELQPL